MANKPTYEELEQKVINIETLEVQHNENMVAFERLFNLSVDMLCIAGMDAYFKLINESFEKTLGYTKEELLKETFIHFIHPDDQASTMAEVEKISHGAPTISFENRYRCKDGSYKWLGWTAMPDPEKGLMYAIARDISDRKHIENLMQQTHDELEQKVKERTAELAKANIELQAEIIERKRAEEVLRERTEALERSNSELEKFAYVASHDLQEPLRMVASYTQLLAKRYKGRLDTDADEFIAYAVDGATRMQVLINDLLTYSRVSTKGNDLKPTYCGTVLEHTLENLKQSLEESGAQVTCDPLPTVMADDVQLGQLFQNLIGNAIKFRSEESPQIYISAKRNEDKWVFSVRDNGIGIDPEFHKRIFVIFQRLHKRGEYPGTGIGLAVCNKIVERHAGHIWVESNPKEGSTFYFTIPLRGGGSHDE